MITERQARRTGQGPAVGDISSAAVTFMLPTPPSVNQLFRNHPKRGRVKTGLYDNWLGHALTSMRLQHIPRVAGRVLAVIGVERMSLSSDLDNRLKAVLDAIVKAGVIDDDSLITAIALTWLPQSNGLTHVQFFSVVSMDLQFRPSPDRATGGWYLPSPNHSGDEYGIEPV